MGYYYRNYSPQQLGVNGVLLTASGNSNAIPVNSSSGVTLEVDVTYAAATDCTFYPMVSGDGGTTWRNVQSVSILSGVGTYSDYQVKITVSAADQSVVLSFADLDSQDLLRLDSITGTSASTDVVSMSAVVKLGRD